MWKKEFTNSGKRVNIMWMSPAAESVAGMPTESEQGIDTRCEKRKQTCPRINNTYYDYD